MERYKEFLQFQKFRFMKKYWTCSGLPQGTDILRFHIGKLCVNWFTDCGEWFMYLRIPKVDEGHCMVKELRLSGAGNFTHEYELQ